MRIQSLFIACLFTLLTSNTYALLPAEDDWQHSLWEDLDRYHSEMIRHGYINENETLNNNLNRILTKLTSDSRIEIYTINSPELNAFTVPNGRIYINLGLISLTENESELASILAHELVHVQKEHSAKNRLEDRKRSKKQFWANSLGLGIGGFAVGIANQMGQSAFSIQQEREADADALVLLEKAQYETKAMPSVFRKMHTYLSDMGLKKEGYFQTHPSLIERANTAEKTIKKTKHALSKTTNKHTTNIRDISVNEYIQWALDNNLYSNLIFTLSHPQFADYTDSPITLFGLAKAYQQRRFTKRESSKQWKKWKREGIVMPKPKQSDIDEAITLYKALLAKNPNHAQGNYDLATLYVETGNGDYQALFKEFLTHAKSDDPQREFAKYYLDSGVN